MDPTDSHCSIVVAIHKDTCKMARWSELTNAPINEDNKTTQQSKDESNSTTRWQPPQGKTWSLQAHA